MYSTMAGACKNSIRVKRQKIKDGCQYRREVRETDNVDKTIDALCSWIQRALNGEIGVEYDVLVEMVKALAGLVSARG